MNIATLTLTEARELLAGKKITATELLEALIKHADALNGDIFAYNHTLWEQAREQARRADITLPLGGLPIAIKDCIVVRGQPATASSKILRGFVSPYNATVVELLMNAGAYPAGRLNMDEFAMGSSTENSADGPTRNPWDLSRIPGGSSGGSAAAVASGMALAALGSDTGGSIRQPAALCGCVGMKPTYGRVSRYGLIAFASSLDQIGPITKTVRDNALLLTHMAAHDPRDNTSLKNAAGDFCRDLGKDIKGVKLGVPKEYFAEGMEPDVKKCISDAVAHLATQGAEVVEVSLPHTSLAVDTYYVIAPAEASSNLARYDGVRYGTRCADAKDVLDLYERTRAEGFGAEVKRRILLGTYVLSSGYYDAYYLRAQKVRTLIRQDFSDAFQKCDALLAPTTPTAAFRLGEKCSDPLQMYLSDIYTIAVNLAGTCGLSLPCGFVQAEGKKLPVGLQIIGRPMDEATVYRIAHFYEQTTPWHKERPPVIAH
jgi:aspartyl-tRNA(Asn)/glutamyl-tRNA(Gln) amidotransferase subunit A